MFWLDYNIIMAKKHQTSLSIFTESVGLYFSNFDKFLKYMTFPVLGQILGLILVFLTTYFYTINMPKLIDKYPNLNSISTLVIIAVIISLPGLAIFCKAFWEYLVAYGAVNSMLDNLLRSGRVYDFEAHTELIKRRAFSFIGLWFLFGIFSIIALCPLMWIICAIFAVYFVLVFQVFTFEPELSPIGCVRKSLILIKGKFAPTLMLILLVGAITYIFIPQIITSGIDAIGLSLALSKAIMPFVNLFPELDFSKYGISPITHTHIAVFTVQITITQILIQYTLPLRSILWSMWYKELNNGIPNIDLPKTKKKKSSKRPSEKLMEASHKKYSTKKTKKEKLDDNILRRAMEKDDDDEE